MVSAASSVTLSVTATSLVQDWAAVSRGRGAPKLCPHLANFYVECQVWAQLGHAPAPADGRPQAQRQPGLRRRRGPAHERRKAQRAEARTAAAYESIAEEVTGSVTEQVMAESVAEQAAETIAEEAAETIAEKAAETI